MRSLLDSYLNPDGSDWGRIDALKDTLARLGAYEPEWWSTWRSVVGKRANDLAEDAAHSDATTYVQLARYLPERKRRECVRHLVQAYDAALEELDRPVPPRPPPAFTPSGQPYPTEMTFDDMSRLNAGLMLTVLPSTMRALLPADPGDAEKSGTNSSPTPISDDIVVERARLYIRSR